jgi:Nickel responsive protein SCO4226-like
VPKYVIEREVPGAGSLTDEDLRVMSLRSIAALDSLGPKIQWIHSYVTDNKVYCVYLAADEETIREHARQAGIPADRISAVRHLLDPINY